MLIQKDRDQMNAVLRLICDKAQRIDQENSARLKPPVAQNVRMQRKAIEEMLALLSELRSLTEEASRMLMIDRDENLEAYQK